MLCALQIPSSFTGQDESMKLALELIGELVWEATPIGCSLGRQRRQSAAGPGGDPSVAPGRRRCLAYRGSWLPTTFGNIDGRQFTCVREWAAFPTVATLSMSIDRRKALLFASASAIRLLLFFGFPSLPDLLTGRVEISTSVTSFKRCNRTTY